MTDFASTATDAGSSGKSIGNSGESSETDVDSDVGKRVDMTCIVTLLPTCGLPDVPGTSLVVGSEDDVCVEQITVILNAGNTPPQFWDAASTGDLTRARAYVNGTRVPLDFLFLDVEGQRAELVVMNTVVCDGAVSIEIEPPRDTNTPVPPGGPFGSEKVYSDAGCVWLYAPIIGTDYNDRSLNSLDFTENAGTSPQPGAGVTASGAIVGDGNDVLYSPAAAPNTPFNAEHTIAWWFKVPTISAIAQMFVSDNNIGNRAFQGRMEANGRVTCFEFLSGGGTSSGPTTTGEYDDDEWHYAVMVYSATSGRTLYIDNNAEIVTDPNTTPGVVTTPWLSLLARHTGSGNNGFLTGRVDTPQIHCEAKSTDWIRDSYNLINDPSSIFTNYTWVPGLNPPPPFTYGSMTDAANVHLLCDDDAATSAVTNTGYQTAITAALSSGNSQDVQTGSDSFALTGNEIIQTNLVTASQYLQAAMRFTLGATNNRNLMGNRAAAGDGWTVSIDASDNLVITVETTSGIFTATGTTDVSVGEHGIFVRMQSGGMQLYLDGSGTPECEVIYTGSIASPGVLDFGGAPDSASGFVGSIRDCAFWQGINYGADRIATWYAGV